MIGRIISGGQTGVDRAALDVAMELGIPVGGYCPRGRIAEDGRIPDKYPLKELTTSSYPARTMANVKAAHATLILANVADHSQLRGGTKLTFDMAYRQGEKGGGLFLADLRNPEMVGQCVEWLRECVAGAGDGAGFVLNVAGQRESKCPGVGEKAAQFLRLVLRQLMAGTGQYGDDGGPGA